MTKNSGQPLKGKTLLITGAASGLGLVSAEQLAARGAEILLHARTLEKAEAACQTIADRTGSNRLFPYSADLGSQSQIRALADRVLERHPRLHVLMNNAGVLLGTRRRTEDGCEMTFAVNHLAGFLLTRRLLPLLTQSAPSRILNVSSIVHRWGDLDFGDLQMERGYRPLPAYYRSKLANVMFTYALARRLAGTGVTVNCLHPGMVDTPFGREGSFLYRLSKSIARPFLYMPPEKGAATQVWMASAPEMEDVTGNYYVRKRSVKSSALSYREEIQEKLWQVSETLCGLERWEGEATS